MASHYNYKVTEQEGINGLNLRYHKEDDRFNNWVFWFYVCRIARMKGWDAALKMVGDRPMPEAILKWKEQNNIK